MKDMSNIQNDLNIILNEISSCISSVSDNDILNICDLINSSENIITIGAGRMGYSLKAFSMRLSHLGYKSFHLGDTNVPRCGQNDLIIVGSGSGETKSILGLVETAKSANSKILCVTQNKSSSIANISDLVITLNNIKSSQIMKTLAEQSTYILYDIISKKLSETKDMSYVEHNHSILE